MIIAVTDLNDNRCFGQSLWCGRRAHKHHWRSRIHGSQKKTLAISTMTPRLPQQEASLRIPCLAAALSTTSALAAAALPGFCAAAEVGGARPSSLARSPQVWVFLSCFHVSPHGPLGGGETHQFKKRGLSRGQILCRKISNRVSGGPFLSWYWYALLWVLFA